MSHLSNKESEYTPGPWIAEIGGHITTTARSESRHVAVTIFMTNKFRGEEEANTRLIAAAPELLETLKAAEHFVDHYSEEWHTAEAALLAKIRAAIAKVEERP